MSALRLKKNFIQRFTEYRYLSTALPQEDEYTSTPQYPPILDLSPEKVSERKKEAEYEAIKAVKTVEEKQIKLNMPRFYGFKCYMLKDIYMPYNGLTLAQHVTRTHLIRDENLPKFYDELVVDNVVNQVKNDLEEAILMELESHRQKNNLCKEKIDKEKTENLLTSALTKQINRILINNLSRTHPHLENTQTNFDSRIESFWYAGGMNPPESIRKKRMGVEWQKPKADEPIDRAMNYVGSADVTLRAEKPLRPLMSLSDVENPDLTVPFYQLDPRTATTEIEYRHIGNVPGFWPGDPHKYGLLSYHRRGYFQNRKFNDPKDDAEAVDRHGILSSFGWLNSQANFLGFTTFNDITYPLVTQTIITNGKIWSFYVYQLNTMLIHSKHAKENPQKNICWATPELKLYEEVVDGKFVGFNDDVLKMLLKFYVNAPEDRLGINMTPFLSKEEKVCADYEDDDKRQWLEREYKVLMRNQQRPRMPREIFAWEKIYKIDHTTKFLDKKRRPFEFGINVWARRLDERLPEYIPRAHRPHLKRWQGRYKKDYFP